MQEQLNALSQAGAWGNVEKPWQDMAFPLVVPNIIIWCKRVFGLTTVWAHPHQAHFQTLEEVACKLLLLADVSVDWPYAFVQLNNTISHALLLNEGHVSTMREGMCSTDVVAGFIICRYANCCSPRTGWCAQMAYMGN